MDSIVSQLQTLFPFDASQRSLWISLAAIAFNPTAWNIVARNGELAFFEEESLQFACDYGLELNSSHWLALPCYFLLLNKSAR